MDSTKLIEPREITSNFNLLIILLIFIYFDFNCKTLLSLLLEMLLDNKLYLPTTKFIEKLSSKLLL